MEIWAQINEKNVSLSVSGGWSLDLQPRPVKAMAIKLPELNHMLEPAGHRDLWHYK